MKHGKLRQNWYFTRTLKSLSECNTSKNCSMTKLMTRLHCSIWMINLDEPRKCIEIIFFVYTYLSKWTNLLTWNIALNEIVHVWVKILTTAAWMAEIILRKKGKKNENKKEREIILNRTCASSMTNLNVLFHASFPFLFFSLKLNLFSVKVKKN